MAGQADKQTNPFRGLVMSLLKLIAREEATGKTAQAYALFDELGWIPKPFAIFSPSEHLVDVRRQVVTHRMNHATLSRGFFALLRMVVSEELGYQYCVSFNAGILKNMGIIDDDQLAAILADPGQAPLDEKEKALLLFVLKAVKTPDDVTAGDVEKVRGLGWTDGDILEATVQGTDMVAMDMLFRIFKLGDAESC
jgi:alkylhydroperoxidase family enzyme